MTETSASINATNLGCSITCKDLAASIRFYRDAIGFGVAQTFENEGKVAGAVVAAGDCRIVLNQDDGKLGWDRIKGQGFYLQINVAGAFKAEALVILTDQVGLLKNFPDESTLISQIPKAQADRFMEFAEGRMKKKVMGAVEAIDEGVGKVIFGDGRVAQPITRALAGAGTHIA